MIRETSGPRSPAPRLVVGIGASAGGLEALHTFFHHLPPDPDLAFVVVQHVDPASHGALVAALRAATGMDVEEIDDELRLESNRVYVAPARRLVELRGGVFQTLPPRRSQRPPALIDHFFYSLAEDQREHAVGVVLSGAGTDGTLGLKAVSDAGGMTIAQASGTALYASMPGNAMTAGVADLVLPPEQMPDELLAYAENLPRLGEADRAGELRAAVTEAIPAIAEVLQRETQNDFRHYKTSTLARRVQRRMQVLRVGRVEDYVARLQNSRSEAQALFREVLISVTAFFRDPEAFDALARIVIPEIFARLADQPLRIWVPGCASGEEAYTLAILVREEMERRGVQPEVQVFATDVDERALRIARQGNYPAGIAEDVTPERLERFFVRRGDRYHVASKVRDLCLFSVHNLISDPPFSRQDLISCRNLLIYLGEHLQKKLIPLFHYALRPGGYLFLGPSETLSTHTELFGVLDARHRISQRKPSAAREDSRLARRSTASREVQPTAPGSETTEIPQLLRRILLDEFTPKGVVVNEEGQILCASGDMSRYLSVSVGSFQNNVVKMARSGLRVGLRTALTSAIQSRRRVVHDSLSVQTPAGSQAVVLTVQPMPQLGEDSALFLVVFEDAGPPVRRDATLGDKADDAEALIQQLEAELGSTRDDLEKSIQDLEAANEELKSSNEELLSMNEELHSANEELETSKEEIQAAHDALARAHADLENVLRSTEIAVVFLDNDLQIRGFTPAVASIYNLIPSDVGRPLWHQTHRAREMPPVPDPAEVRAAGMIEDTIETVDGRWLVRRVHSYRTSEGEENGIVLTFSDVTELQASEKRFRLMADAAPVMIWVSGLDRRCTWFNKGWLEFTGRTLEQERGDGWVDGVHPDDVEHCVQTYTEAFDARRPFQMEYRLRRHDGRYRWILDHGVPLYSGTAFTGYIGSCMDITVRRSAEETRATLAAIVQSSSDAIVSKTLEGVITSWNGGAEQLYGYTAAEAVGQPITLVIPPERVAEEEEILASIRAGKSIDHYETVRLRKGGQRIDVSLSIAAIRDGSGRIVGAAKVARDVSERKRIERELLTHQQRLQRAADALPAAVAYVNAGERYEFVNRRYFEQFQRTREEVLGHTIQEVLGDSNYRIVQEHVKKALAGEQRSFEADLRFPHGVESRAVTYVPYTLPDGSVSGFHVMSVDVTERRRSEQALAEQARLLNASHDAILVWPLGGGIEYWNQGAAQLYGYTAEEAAGRRPLELLHAELPEPWERIEDAVRRHGEWEGRSVHRRSDGGEVVVLTRYQFVQRPGGPVILETNRDITEQARVEDALRAATLAAEAASSSKSEFLANTSHEIRTPMTAILGYADLLARRLEDPDDLQHVRTIRRNGEFLLKIVNDILDLSRIEAGRLEVVRERFAPDMLVHEVVSLMQVRAEDKGLELHVEYQGRLPETIESDPTRLRQILVNLIGNAVKFTESGSVRLVIHARPHHHLLAFEVTDTGIGISEEQQALLFQSFAQGDTSVTRQFSGSGLGLAISQRLASMLGGEITVRSAPGKGSTFTFTISTGNLDDVPFIEPRSAPVRSDPEVAIKERLQCRVLVVDDRLDMRLLAQHVLEEAGAEVVLARNGRDALERLRAHRESGSPVDAVLLDMQMPEMDGYEAARRIRDEGYRGPLIAMTAHAMKGDADKCRSAGCDDYLAKPVDAPTLIETLARHVGGPDGPSARHAAPGTAGSRTRRVLVVDDSRDACHLLQRLLQARGHRVAVAYDGPSALEAARTHRPEVVLLDIALPGLSGHEVARRLRARDATRDSVLIALTGRERVHEDEDGRNAVFDHYVLKPAMIDDLEPLFTRPRDRA